MSAWILLVFSLLGAGLVANAAWPSRGPVSLMPSWIGVFLTTDLVFHNIALQIILVVVFDWFGALDTWPGTLAVIIMIGSSIALLRVWLPALKARDIAEKTAAKLGLQAAAGVPASLMLTPFKRTRKGVEIIRDVEFYHTAGRALKLDIFQPEMTCDDRPALIYVHGGGWVFGDKKDQGLPLCNHMTTLGWVCFNINYRLSPGATWPEHLVDAKAAIAWVREHADDYGVDPGFIAVSGGSAGAHIASMAALTQQEPELQPGFEDEDTSVQAVVTSYGIYDLTNRLGAHNPEFLDKMVGPLIVKADFDKEPEKFTAASPRDHTDRADIPWLVLHGSADELAPVVEAQEFFRLMSESSPAMTAYAELPEASHAFDIYYCHRANAAVDLTARFLTTSLSSSKAD